MSAWKPKRFWKETRVAEADGGFTIMLDGRPLRTPAKADFVLPTRALAEAAAAEWDAQEGEVRPDTMPVTRLANAAIDKVSTQRAEVADLLAAYAETDLVCYRAEGPEGLVARQAKAWDPLLDWAETALGARLVPVIGVIPAPQNPAAIERLSALTHGFDPFELAAFHDLVALTGSLILGFAAVHRYETAERIWDLSRIDETWQEEEWGTDEESAEHTALKRKAFLDAAHNFSLLRRG